MMTVMRLAKIALVLNRADQVEEAKYQFLPNAQYLADTHSGMWFHSWTFAGDHNFARALSARGNSWITIVIPEFIELLDLPQGDATRRHLLSLFEHQAAGTEGHAGRQRPVAHAAERSRQLSSGIGRGGLRLCAAEGPGQTLSARR